MTLPPEQEATRAKCYHPSGQFVEFSKEDIEKSIPERFEKIVRMHPDRLAIKTPVEELTYAELNRAANIVAHSLMDQRFDETVPLALLFDNGIQIITAMLGVLKAGHFFVLLDPSLPTEKLGGVIAKSQARLVLSDDGNLPLAGKLAGAGLKVVEYRTLSGGAITSNCDLSLTPQMFTYVVFTSGSTGEPKGVLYTHQTLLHHVMVMTNSYHICANDKIGLMISTSNATLSTIAHALLNGATLYPYDVQSSGVSELKDWLVREQISICFIPSPLFRNMAATVKAQTHFSALRLIHLRSDKVHKSDIELCKSVLPPNGVVGTGLATTETALIAINLIDRDTKIAGEDVPIGFPVEDKAIALIDDDGNDVGFDQVGEIVVRSKYISPGYWNDPGLTNANFKFDAEDPEMRIYLTGDLGLMLPDGCLIHKGRKDFRVKIRGYGVDLVEVEKALLSRQGIREAVVVSPRSRSGESRLIAYFVSDPDYAPTVSDLRHYLANKLADYMIPSAFVRLDKIPLTANGKVDRSALPAPDDKRPELSTPYAPPRNDTEAGVRQIWQDVLDVRPIGIHDNFFDLGGHSLSATRVVSRVFAQYQLEIPLRSLFQSPTIDAMAAVITAHQGKTLDDGRLANILNELASLSDAEAQRLVSEINSTITKN